MTVRNAGYALDIDPEMLNQARSEVTRRGASVIEWVCADARTIAELIPHEIDYVLIKPMVAGDTALLPEVRHYQDRQAEVTRAAMNS